MKKVFLTLFLMACLGSVCAQRNTEGWTILDPVKADKVIYVSTSSGNDNSGMVYSLPAAAVGNDPFLPSGSVRPFKTVQAAVANLANGEAVWVLLKRGDVFMAGLLPKSGKSEDKPFLYSSYGEANEPPLLKTGAASGVAHCCKTLEHFWVIGLSFYAHTRDPDSPEYLDDAGDRGFYFESVRGDRVANILLEGNVFRYYKDNVIQAFNGTGIVTDITLRRNMVLDGYNSSQSHSESVGLYVHNVTDILLEENVFDHNGWLIPSNGNSEGVDGSNGQATQFSHSTYFVDSRNVTFRNNSFNRPSSNATKWVASGTAKMSNVTIENNLFNDCEIGVSMGTNYPEGSYRFKDITIQDNVMVDQGRSNLTKRQLSWGIDIDDWDGGTFSNNILTSQSMPSRSGFGVQIAGETRGVTVGNNIFYDLQDRRGILVSDKGAYQNITLTKNSFVYGANFKRFVRLEHPNVSGLTFDRNNYYDADNILRPFVILDVDYEYDEWRARFPGENSTVTLPDYPDATRDLDRYIVEVLRLPNRAQYYNELRKQNIHNWRNAYAPGAIVNWIQNGFRTGAQLDRTSPVPDSGELPDIFGECQVASIPGPTASDAISGRIQGVASTTFPIKQSTTLTWYFTDEAGNTTSQEQKIVITDTEAPVPSLQGLPDLIGTCTLAITDIPTANDACNGVIQGVPSVQTDPPFTKSTTITWSFTDLAGNRVDQVQNVIIEPSDNFALDTENLPNVRGACSVTVTTVPTATFGCDQTVTGVPNIDIDMPITESTTIIWRFTDPAGNTLYQQQNVIIAAGDELVPLVENLPDLVGECSVTITAVPIANLGCDETVVGISNSNIDEPITESTTITWSYTDSKGNNISQQQIIQILDTVAPVPVTSTLQELQGVCSVDLADYPTAMDACNGLIVGVPNVQFPISDEEIEAIVWTFTDASNNRSSQVQPVNLRITDQCTDVDVDVAVDKLELEDFEIELVRESCAQQADGLLLVRALKPMDYSVRISNPNNGYNETMVFNEFLSLANLSSGEYTVCFTAAEQDFELCKNVEILVAGELMVDVERLENDQNVHLILSGSDRYAITLNGKSSTTSEDEITLELVTGDNTILVRTANTCQGEFQTTVSVLEPTTGFKRLSVYPNPVIDGLLYIPLGDLEYVPQQFNISNIAGKVIKTHKEFSHDQDEVVIDVSELVQGIYILQGVLTDRIYSARFIKM